MKFAHYSHCWKKPGMTPAERYHQLWRELELADEVGFDYAFSVEHHFRPDESQMSVPSLYCVAGGLRTKRIRIGAMGHIVAMHNPLRIAEEVAVADQMLDGRLELGIVPGILPAYFAPYQADFEHRRERTMEFVDFLKAAYTDGDHFDFEGKYYHFQNVKLSVNPVQRPYPPLWLETRDMDTLKFCAKEGINTGYFILLPREAAAPRYQQYVNWWNEAGWTHKPKIGYLTLTYVDETDKKAVENVRPHLGQAFRGLYSGSTEAEIKATQERTAAFFEQRGDKGAGDIIRNILNPDYLMEHDLAFVGSPDTVAKKLRKYAVSGVFNTFLAEVNFGAMPEKDLMRSIRLLGTEVIPQLRDFEPF